MILNPSAIAVEHIRELIKQRNGFCPCSVKSTEDYRCPCKDFRENNICHCGMFIEEEKDGN